MRAHLAAALLLLVPTLGLAATFAQDPADDEPRDATPQEMDQIVFGWEFAKASNDSERMAGAARLMRPFKNEQLLDIVKTCVEHEGTRVDEEQVLTTLDANEKRDKELVKQLVNLRASRVVAAGVDIGARMASKKSLAVLEKGLKERSVRDNPAAHAALVEALARHPIESKKATKAVRDHLLAFGEDDFAVPGFTLRDDRVGTPRTDTYVAVVRYFARRGTKDLDVAVELAELLHDAARDGVDSEIKKRGDAYRIGREAAAAVLALEAVEALAAVTEQRFAASAEGRTTALEWLAKNAETIGLE